jgi:hypothetical protein
LSSFWFIIKQQWTIEEISIFSNSSHLEWRVELSDTILKWDYPCQVWFNLVQRFQRKIFKCIYSFFNFLYIFFKICYHSFGFDNLKSDDWMHAPNNVNSLFIGEISFNEGILRFLLITFTPYIFTISTIFVLIVHFIYRKIQFEVSIVYLIKIKRHVVALKHQKSKSINNCIWHKLHKFFSNSYTN